MRPASRGLVVTLLLCVPSAVAAADDQRPAPLTRQDCSITVFGHEHPEEVPEALAWERVFNQLLAQPNVLENATRDSAKSEILRNRLVVLKSELASTRATESGPSRVLEVRASRATRDARDDLIRILSPDQFQRLQALANDVSDAVYDLPVSGKIENGRCTVRARGHEFPDLVQDSSLWRFYMFARASASRDQREPNGRLRLEHLKAVQSELPLSPEDIQRVIDRCASVTAHIASLPLAESTDREIARAVLELRAEFIRTFSPVAWTAIKADAERFRSGMVVIYAR